MSNWCECVPTRARGWTRNPLTGQWVCSDCRLPSKAIYMLDSIERGLEQSANGEVSDLGDFTQYLDNPSTI